jgi:septal ring factor EnvC (AmiA/AmiB activator)
VLSLRRRLRALTATSTSDCAHSIGASPKFVHQTGQPVDTSALERQINELRAQIEELKKLNEAIQTLQRLAQTFQQELAGLGVDVDTLKRDFASLRARVEALEGKEEKFKMSGDLTFGVYGAHSIDGKDVFTLNRTRPSDLASSWKPSRFRTSWG